MNEVIEKDKINMIHEIRKKQVMLDSEIFTTKCHKELKYEMEMIKNEGIRIIQRKSF